MSPMIGDHHLYIVSDDPTESENRIGEKLESDMIEMLRAALKELDAPGEQFQRLGIG